MTRTAGLSATRWRFLGGRPSNQMGNSQRIGIEAAAVIGFFMVRVMLAGKSTQWSNGTGPRVGPAGLAEPVSGRSRQSVIEDSLTTNAEDLARPAHLEQGATIAKILRHAHCRACRSAGPHCRTAMRRKRSPDWIRLFRPHAPENARESCPGGTGEAQLAL